MLLTILKVERHGQGPMLLLGLCILCVVMFLLQDAGSVHFKIVGYPSERAGQPTSSKEWTPDWYNQTNITELFKQRTERVR